MNCPNCGNANLENQSYCVNCGAALPELQTRKLEFPDSIKPPKPYAWASPSSPLHDIDGDEPQQVKPLQPPLYTAPPVQAVQPQPISQSPAANNYHCPNCGTTAPPVMKSKISEGGWIVFALMLVFCFPLFWIGFLMRQQYSVCSTCLKRLS